MKRVRVLGSAVLLAISGFALAACELPVEFVVNSTADVVDDSPGNGVCETATPGECTLRAAIQEANASVFNAAIELAADSTYQLSIAGTGEDLGATGDLDTDGNIHVYGNGSTIDAQLLDRVIDHHSGVLFLDDITLTDGQMDEGAGIRNAGVLHLVGSTVTLNRGTLSPSDGVDGNIYQVAGTLNVVGSHITSHLSFAAVSGGIVQVGGNVNLVDSLVTGNVASPSTYELNQLGGTAVIVNSSIRGGSLSLSVPFCTPEGCTSVEIQLTSSALRIEEDATIIRSTVAQGVFDGSQIMFGAGEVEASGSMLYGTCTPHVTSTGYNGLRADFPCADVAQATDLLLLDGPRETQWVPNIGEPIVDAIPIGTPVLCVAPNDHDQRLLPRPQGPGCDIGAIERQPGELSV